MTAADVYLYVLLLVLLACAVDLLIDWAGRAVSRHVAAALNEHADEGGVRR